MYTPWSSLGKEANLVDDESDCRSQRRGEELWSQWQHGQQQRELRHQNPAGQSEGARVRTEARAFTHLHQETPIHPEPD